jgi:CDP-glucose 4,6-dehydratase
MSLWLQSLGADVFGMALPPESDLSMYTIADVDSGMTSTIGDIRDLDQVKDVFASARPELVFHLAAQSLVRRSYLDPVATYATNVMGTLHVLEAARLAQGLRGVVVVTSDKCYENRETFWSYRETDTMGGADPYSSSKSCAEIATAAYRRSFFGADDAALVATARAGNVIGGGDWSEDRLVPDIARAISAGRAAKIRNPESVRPWQHVLEPLRGYLILGAGLLGGDMGLAQGWNFGPGEGGALSVRAVAEEMIRAWGKGSLDFVPDPNGPHEASLLVLDTTKARTLLGYEPVIGIEEGISLTVDWYRRQADSPGDARVITERQIAAYVEALA